MKGGKEGKAKPASFWGKNFGKKFAKGIQK